MRHIDLSLYLVLDPSLCASIGMVETTRAAVLGGVTAVQLRDKTASVASLVETGRALKSVLADTGVPLIVNDSAEAAVAIDADGLHIGQSDGNPAMARALIGDERILGVSVETEAMAAAVDASIVDYAGLGPVFPTATKLDHSEPTGLAGLARLVAACPVPTVAIGGLKADHVEQVFAAGADGLAVISAICGQRDPLAATIRIAKIIAEARS